MTPESSRQRDCRKDTDRDPVSASAVSYQKREGKRDNKHTILGLNAAPVTLKKTKIVKVSDSPIAVAAMRRKAVAIVDRDKSIHH
jgi:hypothetical protein